MGKSMKKTIIFAGALAAAFGTAYAQQSESLDRQVDVTRDYRPTVERATKLSVQPNMTDTVQLRPNFEYQVMPLPINHGFGVTAISPVSVNASTYEPLYPFYLKAGGGFPGNSMADLYFNSTGRGNGSVGFYINHDGHYNKIKNDLGFKRKAMRTENSAGLNGKVRLGNVVLSGEVGFDYDIFSRYGQFSYDGILPVAEPAKVVQQKFMTPRANIKVGNDFSDLTRLNFAVSAGGYYFKDDFSTAETGAQFGLDFAKLFGESLISLSAGYDGTFGNDKMNDFKSHLINVAPRYEFVSDKIKIGLGLNFVFDINDVDNDIAVLPSFDIAAISNPAFVPFIDVESKVERNSYRRLTSLNPYLNEGWPLAENTYRYDLRAGISGTVANVFMYKIYGGAGYVKDAVDFANLFEDGNSSTFVTFREQRIMEYMAGVELEARLASSFSAMLGGRYTGYDTKTFEHPSGLPDYEVSLKLKWNHRNRFFATAGLDLIGDRWFMEYYAGSSTLPEEISFVKEKAVVDVNLGLEYRLKKELGIFVEGHNLTGSKLYRFNHYPEDGPVVNAGVKLLF